MLNFLGECWAFFYAVHFVVEDVLATAWTPTEIDERLEPQVCNGMTEALGRS